MSYRANIFRAVILHGATLGRRLFATILVSVLCGCSTTPAPLVSPILGDKSLSGLQSQYDVQLKEFKEFLNTANGDSAKKGNAKEFLLSGMALAELQCQAYFYQLGVIQQNIAFGKKQVSLLGAATAAIQGLTGADAGTIAITSAMFGLGLASADAYENSYLFSPDVGGVQLLIQGAQNAYRNKLGDDFAVDYASALRHLGAFQTLCEVQSVRRLVNESIAAGKPLATSGDGEQRLNQAIETSEIVAVAAAVGEKMLTNDDLLYLYWLAYLNPSADEKVIIGNGLRSLSNLKVNDKFQPSNVQISQLRQAMGPILAKKPKELNDGVAALKASKPAQSFISPVQQVLDVKSAFVVRVK